MISSMLFGAQEAMVLTVPKSGTHLINKYFTLLRKHHPEVAMPVISHYYSSEEPNFGLSPRAQPILDPDDDRGIIFFIRDIRDVLVSLMFHFERSCFLKDIHLNTSVWKADSPLGMRLMDYIHGDPSHAPIESIFRVNLKYLKEFQALKKPKLVVKFEDLIGPKGGGSARSQLKTIHRLAKFMGVSLTWAEAKYIAKNLHGVKGLGPQKKDEVFHCEGRGEIKGKSTTFRKGKIGGWKLHLSEEHISVLKKNYQWFLDEFNY